MQVGPFWDTIVRDVFPSGGECVVCHNPTTERLYTCYVLIIIHIAHIFGSPSTRNPLVWPGTGNQVKY